MMRSRFRYFFIWWIGVFVMISWLSGCDMFKASEKESRVLKISANPWIGYVPLYYLDCTGRLKKLGFQLRMVHSLGESPGLMSNGLIDGFAATQYELLSYRDELEESVPVFLIDRSSGADKIHSNVSIDTLKKCRTPIHVFMELGSVNQALFRAFTDKYGLKGKRFVFHHKPQNVLAHLRYYPKETVVVVSYEPFSSILEKRGIHEIASSADLDVPIVDALFTRADLAKKLSKRFVGLKNAFWEAKKELNKNPKAFYEKIKDYLGDQSYEMFRKSLKGIKWLPEASDKIKAYLRAQKIDVRYLL